MSSESALWDRVRAELGPWGKLERVENAVGRGTPDVAYALRAGVRGPRGSGWLELKEVDAWPARPTTAFRLPKLTREQVDFHREWRSAGGRAWTLAQVGGREWLLFDPDALTDVFLGRVLAVGAPARSAIPLARGGRFPTGDVLRALAGSAP